MKLFMIIVTTTVCYASGNTNCTSSFEQLNNATEASCPGFDLVFECSTEGPGSTVFKGDFLKCNNKELILLHSRFKGGTNGTCNNGTILGQSFTVDSSSNCYVSRLCMMVTPDMTGKTVRCIHDNGITEQIMSLLIEPMQTNTMSVTTTVTLLTVTSVSVVAVFENNTRTTVYTNYKAIKSLSTEEAIAIVLSCSTFIVGIMIAVIILLTLGFISKKKQLQAFQTPNSAHIIQDESTLTLSTNSRQLQMQATFHREQDDKDDSEYSHLQHPGPQHTLEMKPRAHLQRTYT